MTTQDDWTRQLEAETARIMREIDAEAARMLVEVQAETARQHARLQPDDEPEDDHVAPIVRRSDYVSKDDKLRFCVHDADGLPQLKLVDAGDRLAIWSPLAGGALINPKGPGLRTLGLYATYARGSSHHASAFRTADLRKGQLVELRREPDNEHDRNAVALHGPGARKPFGYVQRGRAPAIAKRIDAGEQLAAVSMRGPGRGRDDDTAFLLIGSDADLRHMLS